ncbi:MAG TPA: M28 family peptidase [Bryobacteraceae bacterium]|nr:M28 family peptidase [Bryobacteraceae bacterium]
MRCAKVLLILWASLAVASDFSGASALKFTAAAVGFGPRPPGSPAIRKLQQYILSNLKQCRCEVIEDNFTARTPKGAVAMKNIIARFRGSSGRAIAVSGHYDTKIFDFHFVGANDAGSSTGFLLEMARVLTGKPRKDDVYLVWFDGEEAVGEWSDTDGIYGSRHLAARWAADGTARRLKALINVDMIGDKDLRIPREMNSTQSLGRLVWQVAADLGYRSRFVNDTIAIEDDHLPFLRIGVPAINLIDFNYGPNHSWWHTPHDTMDKVSSESLQIVGDVVLETIRRLEQ